MKNISVLIMICALILTSCGKYEPANIIKEDEQIKIGLSFDSFVIERWHREQEVFVSRAEELGAKVYVQNANGDAQKQVQQITYLIDQGVDALVIIPTNSEVIAPIIKKAIAKGIKVISYDRLIKNANVDLCITFDNEEVGKLMTSSILGHVSDGQNILVIMGSPVDSNVIIINQVFERMMEKRNINVLEKVYADNWRAEVAFNTVVRHLEAGDTFSGIFCGNDDLAQAAIKALSEYRAAGKVYVVGQDADLSACQHIVEETQDMTVYKDVIKLAKEAAQMTIKLVKGEALGEMETINDGTYEVPYYNIAPVKVTRENIDKVIIDSGFHLKEEVYLNLSVKQEE